MTASNYTAQLQAGLGMVDETRILLDLWEVGMDAPALAQVALQSGQFATMSARRLRNLVVECFAPRYLPQQGAPARLLKALRPALDNRELEQLMFLYTCRANVILADFVCDVYWRNYAAGRETLDNDEARAFVVQANQNGRTSVPWSESTLRRVAAYLTGACADFGLLERGSRQMRRILPFRIEQRVLGLLAYELHFAGYGDNRLVSSPDWALFGLERADVVDELKRLALKGLVIVQTAGNAITIGWHYQSMHEVVDVIAQNKF